MIDIERLSFPKATKLLERINEKKAWFEARIIQPHDFLWQPHLRINGLEEDNLISVLEKRAEIIHLYIAKTLPKIDEFSDYITSSLSERTNKAEEDVERLRELAGKHAGRSSALSGYLERAQTELIGMINTVPDLKAPHHEIQEPEPIREEEEENEGDSDEKAEVKRKLTQEQIDDSSTITTLIEEEEKEDGDLVKLWEGKSTEVTRDVTRKVLRALNLSQDIGIKMETLSLCIKGKGQRILTRANIHSHFHILKDYLDKKLYFIDYMKKEDRYRIKRKGQNEPTTVFETKKSVPKSIPPNEEENQAGGRNGRTSSYESPTVNEQEPVNNLSFLNEALERLQAEYGNNIKLEGQTIKLNAIGGIKMLRILMLLGNRAIEQDILENLAFSQDAKTFNFTVNLVNSAIKKTRRKIRFYSNGENKRYFYLGDLEKDLSELHPPLGVQESLN